MENEEQEQPKTFEDLVALSEVETPPEWFSQNLWAALGPEDIQGDESFQDSLLTAYLKEFHGFKTVAKVTRNVGYHDAWLDHINNVAAVVCAIDAALVHKKTTTKDGKETTTNRSVSWPRVKENGQRDADEVVEALKKACRARFGLAAMKSAPVEGNPFFVVLPQEASLDEEE
jgi:hypothetical protein